MENELDFDLDKNIIESIIHSKLVRYEVLNKMIKKYDLEGNKISIYINIDDILKKFYKNDAVLASMKALYDNDILFLTPELINIIAHYRNYFWTRWQVPSTFYFYYCDKKPKLQCKINKKYMKNIFKNREKDNIKLSGITETIDANLKLVDLLSTYVKHAYFIKSNGLEPSVIPYYLIKKNKDKDVLHMIITDDKLEYQLTNLNNTYILRTRGKNSYLINKNNIYDHLFKNVKYRPKNKISSELYPLIMALSGYKNRSIENIKGLTFVKFIKIIDKYISKGYIKNEYMNFIDKDVFSNDLDDDQIELLTNNYYCTNFKYAYKLLEDFDKERINQCLVDKYDNMSIMNINNKYFPLNNIKLIELCRGI